MIVEEQDELASSVNVEIPAHQAPMETLSEVEVLKKSLQHYKAHNGYLNDSNGYLM